MKYFRYKNRIYKKDSETETSYIVATANYFLHAIDSQVIVKAEFNKKDVVASDDLADLVDCIVIVCKEDYEYKQYYPKIALSQLAIQEYSSESDTFIIYGAIWTDKGLIYVAKMNDKGELVLI